MSNVLHLIPTLAQASSDGSGAAGVFAGFGIVLILLALVTSIFWIWMLIDAITSNLPNTEKLVWVLVIFFLHLLGAILYFFIGRQNRRVVN